MNVFPVPDVGCARCRHRKWPCCLGFWLKGLKGCLNSEINFSRKKRWRHHQLCRDARRKHMGPARQSARHPTRNYRREFPSDWVRWGVSPLEKDIRAENSVQPLSVCSWLFTLWWLWWGSGARERRVLEGEERRNQIGPAWSSQPSHPSTPEREKLCTFKSRLKLWWP